MEVGALCAPLKDIPPQSKQAEIGRVTDWWKMLADCFAGNGKRQAVALLFDIARAESANEAPDLSFSEKAAHVDLARQAFRQLENCAEPGYKFELCFNSNRNLCFKVTDRRNDSVRTISTKFNVFFTEQVEQIWLQMRSSFGQNKPYAIASLNLLCNAAGASEKINRFTQLATLAEPQARGKFELNLEDAATDSFTVTLSFHGVTLFDHLVCPQVRMEEMINVLLSWPGSSGVVKRKYGISETAGMFVLSGVLQNGHFKGDKQTRSEIARILADMFNLGRTVQDDLRSLSKLSRLNNNFKKLFEVTFIRDDHGKTVIALTINGRLYKQGLISATGWADLAQFDLRGSDLSGLNLENADLTGADFRAATMHKVQLRGAQVQGARFDATVLMRGMLSDDQINTLEQDEAASRIQAAWRGKLTAGTKEPGAMVAALRNSDGQVIAYKVRQEKGRYPWVAPPKKTSGEDGAKKRLTGRSDGFVELTIKHPDSFEHVNTFKLQTLNFIREHKLDRFVPQIRVSRDKLMSVDMGEKDLFAYMDEGYRCQPSHFKELARQIQILHSNGYVHRDIKSENMFLKDGAIYLTDLDSMGRSGDFSHHEFAGTSEYAHPALIRIVWFTTYNDIGVAVRLDQYAFVMSMMTPNHNSEPRNGCYSVQTIRQFVGGLPCDQARKWDLFKFMLDPVSNALNYALDEYF